MGQVVLQVKSNGTVLTNLSLKDEKIKKDYLTNSTDTFNP